MARRVGAALAITDYAGVLNVLAPSTPRRKKQAAIANAGLDVALASALLGLGLRRRRRQRLAAIVASASVWFGAGAWLRAATAIDT